VKETSEKVLLQGTYRSSDWDGHDVTRLENGLVELTVLANGGHLADFRFAESSVALSRNVLWESPWRYEKASERRPEDLTQTAGFTGHALCLDYFGAPSATEAATGLTLHGEASTKRWVVTTPENQEGAACQWNVRLPIAHLDFERKIQLGKMESVAYIEETVKNQRGIDHVCDWVQHATFGPPFVNQKEATFVASAVHGLTAPSGYGDDSLVANDEQFSWPYVPLQQPQNGVADLRQPFAVRGKGVTAAVLLDPGRQVEYILAVNEKWRIGVGYCFRRGDFPWMMVWEENCVRTDRPWNGTTQARGMEFGTTPLPIGREETLRRGRLFDTPSWCVIPGNGAKTARYLMFLFKLPDRVSSVRGVEVNGDALNFYGTDARQAFSIPARGCESFLSAGSQ
jgi:hypothetical protein